MRKALRITGVIAFLAIVSIIGGLWLHNNSSKKSLAKYKADLIAKGEKLKIAEFVLPPSTNAEHIRSRKILETNTPPDLTIYPIQMEFVGPGKTRVGWRGQFHAKSTNDGEMIVAGDWQQLALQIKESSGEMQKYIQALEHPTPDTGWLFTDEFQNLIRWAGVKPGLRDVGECLAGELLLNLHEGRFEAAISNLHSLIEMSQLYRNGPDLICELVRVRNVTTGLSATWEALQATNWDEPGMATLQKKWEEVELFDGLERGFRFERTHGNLMMQMFRDTKTSEFGKMFGTTTVTANGSVEPERFSLREFWRFRVAPVFYRLGGMDKDELQHMEYCNGFLDTVRLAKSNHPLSEIVKLEADLQKRATAHFEDASRFSRMVKSYLGSKLTGLTPKVVQTEAFRRLTIAAIALKRHQLKNGSFPQSLNSLVPDFLSAVPIDPMSGKPFCYRLNTDGSFVLYSTGEDGKDDGGDPTPREKDGKFGLWEGRDAVWPTVVVEDAGTTNSAGSVR